MKNIYRTLFAALLFLAVVSAFFYRLIVGIKSDASPGIPVTEIESVDLSTTLVSLGPKWSDWYPESSIRLRTLPRPSGFM